MSVKMNFLLKAFCALAVCLILLACRGAVKFYPQTSMNANTLQALIGKDFSITSGVVPSDDPEVKLQVFNLSTASGVYIGSFSRTVYSTMGRAKSEFLKSRRLSSGLVLRKRTTPHGIDYISNPDETSFLFRHENVLVQGTFKDKMPDSFSGADTKRQLLDAMLKVSQE